MSYMYLFLLRAPQGALVRCDKYRVSRDGKTYYLFSVKSGEWNPVDASRVENVSRVIDDRSTYQPDLLQGELF